MEREDRKVEFNSLIMLCGIWIGTRAAGNWRLALTDMHQNEGRTLNQLLAADYIS